MKRPKFIARSQSFRGPYREEEGTVADVWWVLKHVFYAGVILGLIYVIVVFLFTL